MKTKKMLQYSKNGIIVIIGLMALGIAQNITFAQNKTNNNSNNKRTTTEKKSTAVTIYNENIGIVKEKHTVNLEKGLNYVNLVDVATQIEPTSVNVEIDAQMLEQNYQYDLANMSAILAKFIDREIMLTGKSDVIGKLISVNGNEIVVQTNDGGITMIPNLNEYRLKVDKLPENLKTKPTLEWKLNSDNTKKQDLGLTYKTNGMAWNAKYIGVLNQDETKLSINSWVNITNNSGASFKDAKLKLIAGDVNLVRDYYKGRQELNASARFSYQDEVSSQKTFEERTLMDFHIYELDYSTDLLNNEQKQISLFNANDIKINKKYTHFVYGNDQTGKAKITVEFKNSKENGLGIPIPKGVFGIYKEDKNSNELVGEDKIDHTAKDEIIKLTLGEAFDIVVEDVLVSNKMISERVSENEYKVTIKNKKDTKINIEIMHFWSSNWELLNSNFKSVSENANQLKFPIEVKANSTETLTFKYRANY